MTDYKDAHRARAEAQFKKPDPSASDPAKLARDAEEAARDANIERLRQLRLAKEKSAREAIAVNKVRRSLKGR
ncbi:hypothetical protein [Enterovirga sp.]|uniref:hypothetical protein n=1 Tax=Enterovirga sp. TaxID=2026350 RepID=UPI002CC61777|nr:hypothetical protein [Enterovirga sp.]HMO28582.1 hypothetical protein [Enterovirga sp.]